MVAPVSAFPYEKEEPKEYSPKKVKGTQSVSSSNKDLKAPLPPINEQQELDNVESPE